MQNPMEESDQGIMVSAADQHAGSAAKPPESESLKNAKPDAPESVKSDHVIAGNEMRAVHNTARLSPEVAVVGSSNPYVAPAPAESSQFSLKDAVFTAKDVLGRWISNAGEASRKAEVLSGTTWQHLKTSPSFAEVAIGRIAQGTKVLAEGGYHKIFQQTFETESDEKLFDSFVCYLSTSAGPVMGVVYVSTEKLAFCSDSPILTKLVDGLNIAIIR